MTKDARSGAMGKGAAIDARALAEWLCDCADRAAELAGPPELPPEKRHAMVEALIGSVPQRRPMQPRLVATTDAVLAPEAPSPAPGTRETMTLLATGADPDAARERRAERLNDPSTTDEQRTAIEAANARDERVDALAGFPTVESLRRLAARLNDGPPLTDKQQRAIGRVIDRIQEMRATWGPERVADREWHRALFDLGGQLERAARRFLDASTAAGSDARTARQIVDLVATARAASKPRPEGADDPHLTFPAGGTDSPQASDGGDPLLRPGESGPRYDFLADLEGALHEAGFAWPDAAEFFDHTRQSREAKGKRAKARQRRTRQRDRLRAERAPRAD